MGFLVIVTFLLFVALSIIKTGSQIKLSFKNRCSLYKQTGGESDDPCQSRVLIDDGCSNNEAASCGCGSCSKVPLKGMAKEAYRNDLLCCQNLHVATSVKESCLSLLSLSLRCELMPHLSNNSQWNN